MKAQRIINFFLMLLTTETLRHRGISKKILFSVSLCLCGYCLIINAFTPVAAIAAESVIIDDFEHGLKPQWERKTFKGETRYSVVNDNGTHVLKAESNASATGLIYKYKYEPKDFPILTWRWRVENIINRGDERKKDGDDYAARVYVVFPHWFQPFTKSINYIWANKLQKGEHVPNPFYSRAIMLAVESGRENVGKWITERRNIYEDYKALFGEEPPSAGAIAVMTDTDNTGESATAYYDDIRIEKLRNAP